MEKFDLQQIAVATGHPVRRLRYVLEHGVLPGGQDYSQGHRITRRFTPLEAFAIATAALMLGCGVRRALVAATMEVLSAEHAGSPAIHDPFLSRAFDGTGPADLEIADGVRVRLRVGGSHRPVDTDWLSLTRGVKLGTPAEAALSIVVHLAPLREQLQKSRGTGK